MEGQSLATADPLGLGGLLIDARRVAQLPGPDALTGPLLEALLGAARAGLAHYARQGQSQQPASRRLAFRELGLGIGLAGLADLARAVERLPAAIRARLRAHLEALAPHAALGAGIAAFWRAPAARRTALWEEHRDIDEVMLATALVPEGVLTLEPVAAGAARGT